jgi:hypothetical protein
VYVSYTVRQFVHSLLVISQVLDVPNACPLMLAHIFQRELFKISPMGFLITKQACTIRNFCAVQPPLPGACIWTLKSEAYLGHYARLPWRRVVYVRRVYVRVLQSQFH